MSGIASTSGLGLAAPKGLSNWDAHRPEYRASDPEPQEITPYQALAAAVVQRAVMDAQRGDARARAWLRVGFPTSVWAMVLPEAVGERVEVLACKWVREQ